jgi:hypothetical protein
MADYTYDPEGRGPPILGDSQEILPVIPSSTSLKDLDLIDNPGLIINPEGQSFPDPLQNPLFLSGSGVTQNTEPKPVVTSLTTSLSLKDFLSSITESLLGIINDLLSFKPGQDFVGIFTEGDRLLSVGILLVVITAFLIFFTKI